MNNFHTLVRRLKRAGVETTYFSNYPWMYIDTINGRKVREKYDSEHGWVVGYQPIRPGEEFRFTNTKAIFKLIRKYL